MSDEAEYDLSGQWSGIYIHPAFYPPNMFEATIRDSGGAITGIVTQPGEFFEPPGTVQQAVIDGSRDGSRLSFIKIYDDLNRPTPHYHASSSPAATRRGMDDPRQLVGNLPDGARAARAGGRRTPGQRDDRALIRSMPHAG